MTDLRGTPLVVKVTKANEDDRKQLIPMIDAVPAIAGKVGAPRRRPDYLLADRTHDRLAASVPSVAKPVGKAAFDAPGHPDAWLRSHLLSDIAFTVLLEALQSMRLL